MKRVVYLDNTPLAEALSLWHRRLEEAGLLEPLPGECVPVEHALGRVTAAPVVARQSSPFYHAAAMDGVAVRFHETFGASETRPKRLKVGEQAVFVDTGDPLPEGFNAVIMIEDVHRVSEEEIEILAPVTPWHHVRTIGEDIVATELILPENHVIRPVDQGAMLAADVTQVAVRRRPVVAILPTGDELIQPGDPLAPGRIIEFNSRVMAGMVQAWGGEALRWDIVPDDAGGLRAALEDALQRADVVAVNAGSSAGSEDYTVHVLRELGEVLVHGVNIKPGKPVILALVRGKPVLGIPGYPVSTVLTFELFARPLVYRLQGLEPPPRDQVQAVLSRQVASPLGQEEFLRVKLGRVGEKLIATPVSRGAGVLMSLVRADGIVRIPAPSEGLGAGAPVTVDLLRPLHEITQTLVCIGSHDNTLDLLASALKRRHPGLHLSSAHVGSLGGLMALKRGEAHLAGTHLLDEETGEYNVPYIQRLLPEQGIVLVNLVYREQGLLVPKGNPKGIRGFQDLIRPDVVLINRQKGSGTRLLLDKHLREAGLDPSRIQGYDREEYTHMGVAAAVLSGVADTGLGILAAARALDLDFIPVARERYDLAIPRVFYETPLVQKLLEIVREDLDFRRQVEALGGYDTSDMGRILYEG